MIYFSLKKTSQRNQKGISIICYILFYLHGLSTFLILKFIYKTVLKIAQLKLFRFLYVYLVH